MSLGIEKQIVNDWLEVRKTKKASNTETALNSVLNQIKLTGKTPNECIKIAAENNWSGFKKIWLDNLSGNGTPKRKPTKYDINPDIKNDPDRMKFD